MVTQINVFLIFNIKLFLLLSEYGSVGLVSRLQLEKLLACDDMWFLNTEILI